MASPFKAVELLRITTVLEDCADQLAILGNIMRARQGRSAEEAATADIGDVPHRSHRELGSPVLPAYLSKVQRDRDYVDQAITALLEELQATGTFNSLLCIVDEEEKRKNQLQDVILKEEEGRNKTKVLQRQLQDIRKENALKLQDRDCFIAHLKDQLQETKARTALEKSYVTKCSKLLVYQGQKLNACSEKQLLEMIQFLHDRMEEEKRARAEMEGFLRRHQAHLEEKLETWMEQYERDMEEKQQEINTLRNARASNLLQLQELARKYQHSEQVVKEDRVQKLLLHQQLETERNQRIAALKIQSWWRGTLVRRQMGPHRKEKRMTTAKKKKKKN
ncbi:dynein regulatory complex protein 9-like [Brienomyrus brachyistius]|uniref:dynein regulatory complex protein 9-like n=1 Tax=Brienomyrus brachyistius TaxID=42636 RepID=UPI0020B425E4|nr:dynein regulatory complex protein 9-like [Brienomyrus brachyistius]XP_048836254.1 dynein regulatory complex protein 9-like [Brienomyrus brachyistius]